MINLVGYSLSPTRVASQNESASLGSNGSRGSASLLVPSLEDVARDFDAKKDEPQAELSVDDVGRFFKHNKKRVTWTFLDTTGKEHTVGLLWNK